MTRETERKTWIDKLYIGLLVTVFGGMFIHAPVMVALSSLWPNYGLLIKSWKEILLAVAFGLAIYLLTRNHRWDIVKRPLMYMIIGYVALNLILGIIHFTGATAFASGFMINLRFLLFFVLVYVGVRLYPEIRPLFIKIGVAGAVLVIGFAVLQVWVLPKDALKYLGYGNATIEPYLTVDLNPAFVRINSTMRGPNPLGVFAASCLAMVVAYVTTKRPCRQWWVWTLGAGSLVALWYSYSRSAYGAAVLAVFAVLWLVLRPKISRKSLVNASVVVVLVVAGVLAMRGSYFLSNVVFHDNPTDSNNVNSDAGHASSLANAVVSILNNPLGHGVGSTGSASMLAGHTVVVENYYLAVGYELGILGMVLFLAIFICILWRLCQKVLAQRSDWFIIGTVASAIGLAVAAVLLPVWADDATAILWWGLAGLAMPDIGVMHDKGGQKDATHRLRRRTIQSSPHSI